MEININMLYAVTCELTADNLLDKFESWEVIHSCHALKMLAMLYRFNLV